jgi:AcrR family transcriptional regulator
MDSDAPSPPLTGGALTRSRILDAAAHLMSTIGITRTTTKEIAREAGCSEAALYKHFHDKVEIFVQVLHERVANLPGVLARLAAGADDRPPAEQLREVALLALRFYQRSFPMAASLFASPELLSAHRQRLDLAEDGPHRPVELLCDYLTQERRRGRIASDVDPRAAANLLIGACFHRAFLSLFFAGDAGGRQVRPASDEEFADAVVRTLLSGAAGQRERPAG